MKNMASVAGDMLAQLRQQHREVMRETVAVKAPVKPAVKGWVRFVTMGTKGGQ